MWWTHHLSESSRKELSHLTIPRMPHNYWREPTAEEGESAKQSIRKAIILRLLVWHAMVVVWSGNLLRMSHLHTPARSTTKTVLVVVMNFW